MNLKNNLFLAAVLLLSGGLSAQSIERSVIGAAGTTWTKSGVTLDFTVGEVAVSTYKTATFGITEGFQQPGPPLNIGIADASEGNSLLFFPNPVVDEATLKIGSGERPELYLHDMQGKNVKLFYEVNGQQNGEWTFRLQLNHLATGVYWLRVQSGNGQEDRDVIKIQKF